MVGVPRSGGCIRCLKRRVKCDETRPTCSNCDKYGKSCPGYAKKFRFVPWALQEQSPDNSTGHKNEGKEEPQCSGSSSALIKRTEPTPPIALGGSINSLAAGPDLHQMQFLSILIADVSDGHIPAPDAALMQLWLSCIPERLGKSSTLDQAIRCLAVNHVGTMYGNDAVVIHGRLAYGQALSSLQKAIRDPVKVYSSDTICAAMLLCMYELFAVTTSDHWMKHANGVGRLLQFRGPGWNWSKFDEAMLSAFHDLLVAESLFSLRCCFLDTPEWNRVTMQTSGQHISSPFYNAAQDLARYLAKCPELVKGLYSMASATAVQPSNLIARTLTVYSGVRDWFENFSKIACPPSAILSPMNDPIHPVVLQYSDPATATLYCNYYACIIIIHKVLIASQYEVEHTEEARIFAENICKSVEYLAGTGTMGPYRIAFSLRIAFEVVDTRTQLWIKGWRERFRIFYGGASLLGFSAVKSLGS